MKYIEEDQALEQYRDELDELYPVEIAGMGFLASRILEELDPIAFNCGFTDWLDANELTTDLIGYRIELVEFGTEEDADGDLPSISFECDAEDEDHAREQTEDAYPDCLILEVEEIV